mmetsp:Transcript_29020/g.64016  ORF Transcript_29020/g.64016 Transcript_29020/m.64016 type:complete len:454 (-) Transcript_29020:627-1988(-)
MEAVPFEEFVLPPEASSITGTLDFALKRRAPDTDSGEAQGYETKRFKREVLRPGIPAATPTSVCRFAEKLSPPLREDDKDGHYVYELGENLSSRYKILSKMGEGTFGRVLECWDRKRKDYVAVKIVRNIDKYRHAAMIELEVLNTLERNDPDGKYHCVALREWFDYRGHVCMVFEKLGPSLFDFLRKNKYRPFAVDLIQEFSRQLLESVAYMHELHLVHTDLKPENILLVSLDYTRSSSVGSCRSAPRVPSSAAIKVIDFGSATFEDQYHSSIVSTRHYRAPEVILGNGWSYPCDMWSIGCIMVELITGDALFQTHENLEHLAMMEQVLGPIPDAVVTRANKQGAKYFAKSKLTWPEGAPSKKSVKAVKRLTNLTQLILEHGHTSAWPYVEMLCDLLHGLLRYDAEERLTAQEAMAHPFFQLQLQPSVAVVAKQSLSTAPTVAPSTSGTGADS